MRDTWRLLPAPVRRLPADLGLVGVLTALAVLAVALPGVRETPLRPVLTLPLLGFLPGYALLAALFPDAGPSDSGVDAGRDGGSLTALGRLSFSLGLSLAVVPLVGLALAVTPRALDLTGLVLGLGGVTLAGGVAGAVRRWQLPPGERFEARELLARRQTDRTPRPGELATRVRSGLFEPGSRLDAALNVALVAGLVLAVGATGVAVLSDGGGGFTALYVLSESEGELGTEYPTAVAVNESVPLVVGVDNREGEARTYTVVLQLQTVEGPGDDPVVGSRRELDRFTAQVDAGGTWRRSHEVQPTVTGERVRLQYLLYRGDPPAIADRESAYRTAHLWLAVTESE